jgi:hypothetical protein
MIDISRSQVYFLSRPQTRHPYATQVMEQMDRLRHRRQPPIEGRSYSPFKPRAHTRRRPILSDPIVVQRPARDSMMNDCHSGILVCRIKPPHVTNCRSLRRTRAKDRA